jgi:hypothetical protein
MKLETIDWGKTAALVWVVFCAVWTFKNLRDIHRISKERARRQKVMDQLTVIFNKAMEARLSDDIPKFISQVERYTELSEAFEAEFTPNKKEPSVPISES